MSLFPDADVPECRAAPHRPPEGPNEDIRVCPWCGAADHTWRPPGEDYGWHADDCSLPRLHPGHCVGGGSGHPAAPVIRGFWPYDPRSEDFRG